MEVERKELKSKYTRQRQQL